MQTPLTRLPDWQPRLRRFLAQSDGRPLIAGKHDCCLFGAGAIEAETGVDLAAPWRGRYSTFRGGYRILRKAGYSDHVALIASFLQEIPVFAVRAGDIAIVPSESGDAVGVVQGEAVYVLGLDGRLSLVPLAPVLRLFRVGEA
ncbi:MAG: hypothetical protein MRY77_14550 [Rhodobacteraceae bacterium]|nr:hypothetical protein [Paracoccaceae bacterium]